MNKICINNTCFEFTVYHFLFLLLLVIICNYASYFFFPSTNKKDKLREDLYNINYNIPDDIYPGQYLTRSTLVTKTPEQYDELNKDYDKFDFTKPRITSAIPPEYQQISNPVPQIHNDAPTPTFIPTIKNSIYLMNSSEGSNVSPITENSHARRAGIYHSEEDPTPLQLPSLRRIDSPRRRNSTRKRDSVRPKPLPLPLPTKKPRKSKKSRRSSRSTSSRSVHSYASSITLGARTPNRAERKELKEKRRQRRIAEQQKEKEKERKEKEKERERQIEKERQAQIEKKAEEKRQREKQAEKQRQKQLQKDMMQKEKKNSKKAEKQKQIEKQKQKKIEKMESGYEIQAGMNMYPTNIPPGPNGLRPLVGEQINKTNRGIPVDGVQIPNGGLVDYELIRQRDLGVLANPLLPPEKRTERPTIDMTLPLLKNKYIGLPTRGSFDTYQQLGYLVNNADEEKVLKLFGRQKYPGSTQYEYYAIKSTAADQYKIPLYDQRKQLFEGDQITITKMFPGTYKFFEFKQEELI